MKKETLDFLKDLQKELIEQDNYCQASPRFWVVRQYEYAECIEDNAEDCHYYDENDCYEYYSFEEFKEHLLESYGEDLEEEGINLQEITNFADLPDKYQEDIRLVPVAEIPVIQDNTMFLTARECEEHIERNKHHYNKTAKPYCQTAWRSPQVEKLWEILEKEDWGN